MKQELIYSMICEQFTRNLNALNNILGKAKLHAEERKWDPNQWTQMRLAPDMFALARQVQITSDTAKGVAARLAGKTPPAWSDDEKSIDELISRVNKTVEYLATFKAQDFGQYSVQKISFPWYPGHFLEGHNYLVSHAIPNFYFHLATTYNLLRLHGVNLGKGDFLGEMQWHKA